MSEQNPHDGLTWRQMNTDPACAEQRIEVAWGAWPYRVIGYGTDAVVERFVPGAPVRKRVITRGDRPFDAMMLEARSIAEEWEARMQAEAARAGVVAIR